MTLSEQEIDEIIKDEIEIDAYSEIEVHMGWEIYMEENLTYPFKADYLIKLVEGKEEWTRIEIVSGIENQAHSISSYMVEAVINGMIIQVKLSDLMNIEGNNDTEKGIAVWKYAFMDNH